MLWLVHGQKRWFLYPPCGAPDDETTAAQGLGAWAWAYLIHETGGDVDVALQDFIVDVPMMGREASFELHFGRTMDTFFEEFDAFVLGDDDAWRAILQ